MALDTSAWQAITSLRPGMDFAQWIEAQAGRVTGHRDPGTPADHRTVALVDDAEAVVLRAVLDDAGTRVESVTFDGDMPTGTLIDGVRFNADRAELRAKVGPFCVEVSPEAQALKRRSGLDRLLARRDEHTSFVLSFAGPSLVSLSIVSDTSFPAAMYRADAFFEDLNFKLAVLDGLLSAQHIALPPKPPIVGIDDEDEAYDAALDARLAFWYAYPLSADLLAKVTAISLDPRGAIYTDIDPEFEDNSDDFNVMSLGGVAHLSGLETLSISGLAVQISLTPLAGHRGLRTVTLDTLEVEDLGALEKLPRLAALNGRFDRRSDFDQSIVSRLAVRGVKVKETTRPAPKKGGRGR